MSYATVQTGFSSVIQKISGYSSANVKENGDWRIIGEGNTSGVVLLPGSFAQRQITVKNRTEVVWNVQIQLFALNDGEETTTLASLMTEREKIIDEVNKWPHLDGVVGVMDALIQAGPEPVKVEGSQFFMQQLTGMAIEVKEFTRSE